MALLIPVRDKWGGQWSSPSLALHVLKAMDRYKSTTEGSTTTAQCIAHVLQQKRMRHLNLLYSPTLHLSGRPGSLPDLAFGTTLITNQSSVFSLGDHLKVSFHFPVNFKLGCSFCNRIGPCPAMHVPSHVGITCNEQAYKLALLGSKLPSGEAHWVSFPGSNADLFSLSFAQRQTSNQTAIDQAEPLRPLQTQTYIYNQLRAATWKQGIPASSFSKRAQKTLGDNFSFQNYQIMLSLGKAPP